MATATAAELLKRVIVICSTFPSRIEGEVENTIINETYLMALGGCDILDVDKVLDDLIHGFPEPRKWRPTPPELAQMVRDAASLREIDPDLKNRFKVFVAKGTPQWNAWQSLRRTPDTMSEVYGKIGWWFRSEWPPGADEDKWILEAMAKNERQKKPISPEKLAKLEKIMTDMDNLFQRNGRWDKGAWVEEMKRHGTITVAK